MPNTGTCGLFFLLGQDFVPVPLISVSAKATVIHCVGRVVLTQVYHNEEKNSIEVTYFFPTDPLGAVTGFVAKVGGRTLKGVVKTNDEAERDYDEAMKKGKLALLGSEITADIFKLQLGNLKPGASAIVKITYTTEIRNDPDSHSIRFVLPTTIAQRYVPPTSSGRAADNISSIQYSSTPLVPISIRIAVFFQGGIRNIRSLSGHNIAVESSHNDLSNPTWCTAIIGLSSNTTEMDRDFVLLITPTEAVMRPRVYSEILDNSACYMLHLIPNFALKDIKAEVIVLVDRSRSMLGTCIQLAATALALLFHSFPVDCYFNIIGFGDKFNPLFPKSLKYGKSSLLAAEEYCKFLYADMGGTEILAPLQFIYRNKPVSKKYLRQLFILTDGHVSNTSEVIDLVRQNACSTRVFAIGIGSSSCRELVEGIAKAGQGTAAFVERDESIRTATLAQLKHALQPSLKDVKIEWLGAPENTVIQSPKFVPPIFAGSQLIVFGMFRDLHTKPSGVKVSAISPDGILNFEVDIHSQNQSHKGMTGLLHLLGSIKMTRELEILKPVDWERELVQISVTKGFATSLTSFVVVDESSEMEVVYSTCQKRHVPQQNTSSSPPMGHAARSGSRSPQMCCRRYLLITYSDPPTVALTASDKNDDFMMFCTRQNFDGSFTPELVAEAMKIGVEVLLSASKPGWDLAAFSTALAIIFLRENHPEKHELWELIVDKAERWLVLQPRFTEMLKEAIRTITHMGNNSKASQKERRKGYYDVISIGKKTA